MREKKLRPWVPAAFCATLALITTIGNLWADNSATFVFMIFLPVCFVFVGEILTQLQNENREMRLRLDALDNKKSTTLPNRDA